MGGWILWDKKGFVRTWKIGDFLVMGVDVMYVLGNGEWGFG